MNWILCHSRTNLLNKNSKHYILNIHYSHEIILISFKKGTAWVLTFDAGHSEIYSGLAIRFELPAYVTCF